MMNCMHFVTVHFVTLFSSLSLSISISISSSIVIFIFISFFIYRIGVEFINDEIIFFCIMRISHVFDIGIFISLTVIVAAVSIITGDSIIFCLITIIVFHIIVNAIFLVRNFNVRSVFSGHIFFANILISLVATITQFSNTINLI